MMSAAPWSTCTRTGIWKVDREIRLDLLKKKAVTDHIARTVLAGIIGNSLGRITRTQRP
jgi:hypothetical protein